MKKLLLAAFLLTASVGIVGINSQATYARSGSHETPIPASAVPKAVKLNFKSMYPTATNVQWGTSTIYYGGTTYTAQFRLNSQKWEATYYANGSFISAAPKL